MWFNNDIIVPAVFPSHNSGFPFTWPPQKKDDKKKDPPWWRTPGLPSPGEIRDDDTTTQ